MISSSQPPYALALVFTGHMIDLPDRGTPRFPPDMEEDARHAILLSVAEARGAASGPVVALASAARGGDILFLEACRSLNIPFHIVLPSGVEDFLEGSVRGAAGGGWERRFHALWTSLPADRRETLDVPPGLNPYDLCNHRMLAKAEALGRTVRLLALWDGREKEPLPGGAASFVLMVRRAGGECARIDAGALLLETQRRRERLAASHNDNPGDQQPLAALASRRAP